MTEPEYLRPETSVMVSYGVALTHPDQVFRLDKLVGSRVMKTKKKSAEKNGKPTKDESWLLDAPIGDVLSHFLDSGAFSLWSIAAKYAEEHPETGRWAYYDLPESWQYLDDYAAFVKKYKDGIDLYANVDVIGNPDLTYRNQKYLEDKHGLEPVPVVHYKTDLDWLRRYMKEGYELIGLGGLVGSLAKEGCRRWIDRAFDVVCDQPSRLPKVKIHGFGVTSYDLLLRFPWYSVDSSSWTKIAAFGGILVPHKRGGKFTFDEQPYIVKISHESPQTTELGKHYSTMTPAEKKIVAEWLELIDMKLGKLDPKTKEVVEFGVMTRHTDRREANLKFFERMQGALPKYPWPFRLEGRRKGLGLL